MSFNTNQIVTHGDINEVLDYYNLGDKDILKELIDLCKD